MSTSQGVGAKGAVRRVRRVTLAAVALALCVAPVAGAHAPDKHGGGAIVAPAKDKWWGEVWAQLYSLPLSENPFVGNGNHCMTVGHKVLQSWGGLPCTIERGTRFTLGFGSGWSNVEDPFPQTRAEQLAAAFDLDQFVVSFTVAVDADAPVEIRTPRFQVFSPQRAVLLPEDNIIDDPENNIDLPAQPITLSAHGWTAVVRKLGLGQHTIVADVGLADGNHLVVPHSITVVPRR